MVRLAFLSVAVAWVVALLCLLVLLDPTAKPSATSTSVVLSAALLFVAFVVARQATRDAWRTAKFGAWMSLVPVLVAGAVVAASDSTQSRLRAGLVGVPLLALGVACAAFIIRNQFVKDAVPDLLRERFPTSRIWETEGVQWSVAADAHRIGPDGTVVSIYVQNCVAAQRQVEIILRDAAGLFFRSGSLVWPQSGSLSGPESLGVQLEAGDAGRFLVPIHATGRRSGDVELHFELAASGPAAPRVRRWHAKASATRGSAWVDLLRPFLGHVGHLLGDDEHVHLEFSVSGEAGAPSVAPARWELLWRQSRDAP